MARATWRVALAGAVALLATMTSAHAQDDGLETFRLQLRWLPQAQFMGFYVAQAEGLYEREGLRVEILPGGDDVNANEVMRDGRADAMIGWLPAALEARRDGLPLINIAQILQRSGLSLVCERDRGIHRPGDLSGRTASAWFSGSEISLIAWAGALGLDIVDGESDPNPGSLAIRPQGGDLEAFIAGEVDCVSVMTYNEYWELLGLGERISDMTVFRYEDLGFGLLEDGIYVDARRLEDPAFEDLATRFLRASLAGWRRAVEQPTAAALIVTHAMQGGGGDDADERQVHMAQEIASLVGDPATIGLLDLKDFDRTLALLTAGGKGDVVGLPGRAWTHKLWEIASDNQDSIFSRETLYQLGIVVASPWFYALDLIGTAAFGLAGFLRARERRYDLWGALILTMLPAVGGGTLRDLLVGGERYPPFIFQDPVYLYIVFAVVILGSLATRFIVFPGFMRRQFDRSLLIADTIGLVSFTVIGAKIAIIANLDWFWIPICSALTCAGGGMLLDVVTGREPRTFKGEPYEELAVCGGFLMIVLLLFADRFEHVDRYIAVTIVLVMAVLFALRILIVRRGWRMPLLAGHN